MHLYNYRPLSLPARAEASFPRGRENGMPCQSGKIREKTEKFDPGAWNISPDGITT
jgi:hypothetical protein